jgi:GxxExxY protein
MISEGIDDLTELVIGCAIRVHHALGPGLLESIYRDCLVIELIAGGLTVEVERCVPIDYRGQRVRDDLRLDVLVNGRPVVEVKAVERLHRCTRRRSSHT